MAPVDAEMLQRFGRKCTRKIADGQPLTEMEAAAFRNLLDAYDIAGRPLLGRYAGSDGCIDTVTGRCGHRPPEFEHGA